MPRRRKSGKPKPNDIRIRALRVAEREARRGVKEQGGNNRGRRVAEYLRSAGFNYPAPWCMAFVHWCYQAVGKYLGGGASVGFFEAWARKNGEIVTRPYRGDIGCWEYSGDSWPDHVFFIRRVLRMGPLWMLRTVEGNTSSGEAGSQGDGDGVYTRTRIVRNRRVRGALFVRIT